MSSAAAPLVIASPSPQPESPRPEAPQKTPRQPLWPTLAMIAIDLLIGLAVFNQQELVAASQALPPSVREFFSPEIMVFILVGFAAELIDGALGMAYGLSAGSLLMSAGVPPLATSAGVHLAEMFTTAASGISHLRMGNVNKKLFRSLLLPGIIGVVLGAYVLSSIDGKMLKPYIALYLAIMGGLIIFRAFRKPRKRKTRFIAPLAVFGGFVDAVGAGGWGPIVVSTLLNRGRSPRYTIGSVNLAEFFIAIAGSITFLVTMEGFEYWRIILGLIIGGVLAAPFGAWVCKRVRQPVLMFMVGVLILLLSIRTIYMVWG